MNDENQPKNQQAIDLDLSGEENDWERRAQVKANEIEGGPETEMKYSSSPDKLGKLADFDPKDIKVDFEKPDDSPGMQNPYPGPSSGDSRFEQSCFMGPVCTLIRRFLNWAGACLALMSCILDILYLGKVQFHDKGLYIGIALVWVARLIITVLLAMKYYYEKVINYRPRMTDTVYRPDDEQEERDEKGADTSNEAEQEVRKQGYYLYGSMWALLWGGFYRVLPSESFAWELGTGYAVELFIGLFPTLFMMIQTNVASEKELIGTQSAAILVKLFSLIVFTFELTTMIAEIWHYRRIRKSEIGGVQKITEEERRAKNWRVAFATGAASFAIILLTVIIGMATIPARECEAGTALELATCQACQADNCLDCAGNSQICNTCQIGFSPFEEGKRCQDCDNDPSMVQCESCVPGENGPKCVQCAKGYRLANGKCVDCASNCENCGQNTCLKCQSGFYLEGGECIQCKESLAHCLKCGNKETCDVCDSRIALKDGNGKCTQCVDSLNWKSSGQGKCQCKDTFYTDVEDGYKCKKCDQAIKGCATCDLTASPGNNEWIKLGYDADVLTTASKQYLQCKITNDDGSLVETENTQNNNQQGSAGTNPQAVSGTEIKKCDDLIEGCAKCNEDGSSCKECHFKWYMYRRGDSNRCGSCQDTRRFGGCVHCNANDGCTECQTSHFHFGYKCYKWFI